MVVVDTAVLKAEEDTEGMVIGQAVVEEAAEAAVMAVIEVFSLIYVFVVFLCELDLKMFVAI